MILSRAVILILVLAKLAWASQSPTSFSNISNTVWLKVSATADGPNVLVNDVVTVRLDGEDGLVALKPIGLPGSKVTIPRELIQARLARSKKGRYRVEGSAVEVIASKQIIPGETIQRFASESLTERLRSLSNNAKVRIFDGGQKPRDLNVPDRSSRMELEPAIGLPRGNVVLTVRVAQDDARGRAVQVANVPVVFMVQVSETVAVANAPVRQGQIIQADQIAMQEIDTTFLRGMPFGDAQNLVGLRSRAYIAKGKAITTDLVTLPPIVRRGDMVRLLVRSGGVQLEVPAKALRDAALGESLPVEVEGRKKTVQGRAVSEGTVLKDAL